MDFPHRFKFVTHASCYSLTKSNVWLLIGLRKESPVSELRGRLPALLLLCGFFFCLELTPGDGIKCFGKCCFRKIINIEVVTAAIAIWRKVEVTFKTFGQNTVANGLCFQ